MRWTAPVSLLHGWENLFGSLRDGKSLGLLAARTPSTAEDGKFDRPTRLACKKRKATLDSRLNGS
jgi:hypothetical protein